MHDLAPTVGKRFQQRGPARRVGVQASGEGLFLSKENPELPPTWGDSNEGP